MRSVLPIAVVLGGALLQFAGQSAWGAEASAKPADTVILLEQTPTNYQADGQFAAVLGKAAPGKTAVRASEGMSNVIARLYGVGKSNAPAVFRQLDVDIRQRNGLTADEGLIRGQVLSVPDIPPMAKPAGDPANAFNAVPKINLDTRGATATAGPIDVTADRQLAASPLNREAQTTVQVREYSVEAGEAAAARNPQALVASAPVRLEFQTQGQSAALAPLSQAAVGAIHAAASAAPVQNPVLIIFDDHFPSLADEEAARAFLLAGIKTLRADRHAGPLQPMSAACAPAAKIVSAATFQGHPHAAEIKSALEEYTAAAGAGSPVQVFYVPTLKGNACADEVLEQLIEVFAIDQLLNGAEPPSIPKPTLTSARKIAQRVVSEIGSNTQAGAGDSNLEVIQAALDFAARYGALAHRPIFVSMSWTFDNGPLKPRVPDIFGGLFVVAAGNYFADDGGHPLGPVTKTMIQFADRSTLPGDMLAVMNVDATGRLTCNSSLVDPNGQAFATAYSGAIVGDCGTSFSTPRVAWLLALHESTRPAPPNPADLALKLRREMHDKGFSGETENSVSTLDVVTLLK